MNICKFEKNCKLCSEHISKNIKTCEICAALVTREGVQEIIISEGTKLEIKDDNKKIPTEPIVGAVRIFIVWD